MHRIVLALAVVGAPYAELHLFRFVWFVHCLRGTPQSTRLVSFFISLLTTRFPTAGLSAAHVHPDWLLDWSLAAKWVELLITYLTAAYLTQQRSKHDEGWSNFHLKNFGSVMIKSSGQLSGKRKRVPCVCMYPRPPPPLVYPHPGDQSSNPRSQS